MAEGTRRGGMTIRGSLCFAFRLSHGALYRILLQDFGAEDIMGLGYSK